MKNNVEIILKNGSKKIIIICNKDEGNTESVTLKWIKERKIYVFPNHKAKTKVDKIQEICRLIV